MRSIHLCTNPTPTEVILSIVYFRSKAILFPSGSAVNALMTSYLASVCSRSSVVLTSPRWWYACVSKQSKFLSNSTRSRSYKAVKASTFAQDLRRTCKQRITKASGNVSQYKYPFRCYHLFLDHARSRTTLCGGATKVHFSFPVIRSYHLWTQQVELLAPP